MSEIETDTPMKGSPIHVEVLALVAQGKPLPGGPGYSQAYFDLGFAGLLQNEVGKHGATRRGLLTLRSWCCAIDAIDDDPRLQHEFPDLTA